MPSPSTTLMTATSRLVAKPTSGVTAPEVNQSSRPSRTTIILLAVIGSLVVIVFTGFFIFSRIKSYRARRPKKPLASLSFNLSTDRGIQTSPRLSTREVNATLSNESRRVGSAYWSPLSRPRQTREMSVKDEEPRYRFSSHPYKAATPISSWPPNQTQSDLRSLALALPVSSHAPGTHGSCSSRLTFVGHTARGSQSSSEHARSDSAGKSDDAMDPSSRPSLKISTAPPVQNPASNQKSNIPERKYSKSFLIFDDGDSPTSSSYVVFKPISTLPATPEHVHHVASNPNGGPAPASAKMMTATASYKPRLQDELSLNVGDVVKLVQEYDDGWCVVEQVGTANVQSGAVPKMCLRDRAST